MIYERLQFKLLEQIRSPKNPTVCTCFFYTSILFLMYQLSLVLEIVRNEFLIDIGEAEEQTNKFQMAPYLYHENVSKGLVKYAGRAAVAKDIYSKEDAFHQFVVMIQSNYPQQAETILARSDLKSCVVKKHKFITIANITVGTRARDTPAPGKQKACKDSDIELKTDATPMSSRNAGPNDEVPQFATVLDISLFNRS